MGIFTFPQLTDVYQYKCTNIYVIFLDAITGRYQNKLLNRKMANNYIVIIMVFGM